MTRVLVVDDDALVRQLLTKILTDQGIEVVGDAADGDEVVAAIHAHRPDVVLMDLHMARVGGVAAITEVRRLPHPPAVIALTSFGTDETVLEALRAGAQGFLTKDADPGQIADSIEKVAGGGGALDPSSARVAIRHVADGRDSRRSTARLALARLTERELELAQHLPSGLTNAEIGVVAFCSESTVKAHLSRAMGKLGVATRTELGVIVDRADLSLRQPEA
ncbi:response regulator transcription factor [Cellulomonas cellasea]|uniref:response regulator transcription factor n=1 Tax=Cellulomonas cellasea TaxID=43670 RepID=UPI0025A4AE12|nr:response regulator transcription factor [Cellulomonas cellasea]MDM8086133.1 response regulator transcription factor [Cellulomonas cellasea]